MNAGEPRPGSGPAGLIAAGRVRGAWGVRGEIRIEPFNEPRESLLLTLRDWWLQSADAPVAGRAVRVARARVHGASEIVARLTDVDDREAAQSLTGCTVLLARSQFPEPDADEVYWADLIGCRVFDPDGAELGIITAIDDHPAHPLLRVEAPRTDEAGGRAEPTGPEGKKSEEGKKGREGAGRARRPDAASVHLIPLVPERLLSVDPAAHIVIADWRADY